MNKSNCVATYTGGVGHQFTIRKDEHDQEENSSMMFNMHFNSVTLFSSSGIISIWIWQVCAFS
jgi:hypothetical protein